MDYQEIVNYLEGLERFGIQLGLHNITSLLTLLGNPHQSLRTIHIAGTNGKGSTSAFLSFILRETGIKTGLYTSPHLLDIRERIAIDGVVIPKEKLKELVIRIKPHIRRLANIPFAHPTYFEVLTAIAFTYFQEEGVELSILEVGLGGRLDATNVATPWVSIITNVDLDHTERLGKTIKEIAFEKAGIIKEGGIVITAEEKEEAIKVIERVSRDKGATLYRVGRDVILESERDGFTVCTQKKRYSNLKINLLGAYQMINASLAIAAVELLEDHGLKVSEAQIREGLEKSFWPGRLEIVSQRPQLVLDGAHNPAAARKLTHALLELFNFERLILVLGILKDKDIEGIVSAFLPIFSQKEHWVIATQPKIGRALEGEGLAKRIEKFTCKFEIQREVATAIKVALNLAGEQDLICVTGSLYTIAEAKEFWNAREKMIESTVD